MIVLRDKPRSTFPITISLNGGITLESIPNHEGEYSIMIAGNSIGGLTLSGENKKKLEVEIHDKDIPTKAYNILLSWIIRQAKERGFEEVELCTLPGETKTAKKFGFEVSEEGRHNKYTLTLGNTTRMFSGEVQEKQTSDDRLAKTMTNLGKGGLVVAGGVGVASGVQAGRAAAMAPQFIKDAREVMQLRKNKVVRKAVKEGVHEVADRVRFIPGLGKVLEDKLRTAESIYDNTKFSKLDRAQKMINLGNTLSNQNRTILGNMGHWAKSGADHVVKKVPGITSKQRALIDKGADTVGRLGKFGLRVKNAKVLGKTALGIGTVAGAAYLHGKELQSYNDRLRK